MEFSVTIKLNLQSRNPIPIADKRAKKDTASSSNTSVPC